MIPHTQMVQVETIIYLSCQTLASWIFNYYVIIYINGLVRGVERQEIITMKNVYFGKVKLRQNVSVGLYVHFSL